MAGKNAMKISLTTLSRRRDDVLDALKRNERISVSDGNEVVALLLPAGADKADIPLPRTAAQGLWADRDDIVDPTAWVREQREIRRRKRIFRRRVAGDD